EPGQVKHSHPTKKILDVEFVETLHQWKLSFHLDNQTTYRFVGLPEGDAKKLRGVCEDLGLEVFTRQVNIAGRSWGTLDIQHGLATLSLDSKITFDVPLNTLTQTIAQSKYELEMICKTNDNVRENA